MQETTNFWDWTVSTFPDDESPEFLQAVVAPSQSAQVPQRNGDYPTGDFA
jgi:hypothetical protein